MKITLEIMNVVEPHVITFSFDAGILMQNCSCTVKKIVLSVKWTIFCYMFMHINYRQVRKVILWNYFFEASVYSGI